MPNEQAHIRLALRNQATLSYLLRDRDHHPEWTATIAFYKALHMVEAVFAHHGQHGVNHELRDAMLKRDSRYHQMWKHYRVLWTASMIARYMESQGCHKPYEVFTDYMKPEVVEADLVKHRLHQLQMSASKFLSPTSHAALQSDGV